MLYEESPYTIRSAFTHASFGYVSLLLLRQWPGYFFPWYSISVPAAHISGRPRLPSPKPANNWNSMEMGWSCSLRTAFWILWMIRCHYWASYTKAPFAILLKTIHRCQMKVFDKTNVPNWSLKSPYWIITDLYFPSISKCILPQFFIVFMMVDFYIPSLGDLLPLNREIQSFFSLGIDRIL